MEYGIDGQPENKMPPLMAWRRRGAEVCADLSAVRRPTAGCYTGEVPEQHRKEFFIWECYFMFLKSQGEQQNHQEAKLSSVCSSDQLSKVCLLNSPLWMLLVPFAPVYSLSQQTEDGSRGLIQLPSQLLPWHTCAFIILLFKDIFFLYISVGCSRNQKFQWE